MAEKEKEKNGGKANGKAEKTEKADVKKATPKDPSDKSKDNSKDGKGSKNVKTADAKNTKKDGKKDGKDGKKVVKYFKDLKSEFKKVVWPSKKQVFNHTSAVLTAVFIIGLFIFAVDRGFLFLLELLTK